MTAKISTSQEACGARQNHPGLLVCKHAVRRSIKTGHELVSTGGGGKTIPCGICHGANLEGIGPVPALTGRSPSYAAHQMYDIQCGARNGPSSQLMKQAVANLTADDMRVRFQLTWPQLLHRQSDYSLDGTLGSSKRTTSEVSRIGRKEGMADLLN